MSSTLPKYDIVLLGVGHTNAHVLRMWRAEPLAKARLTCVSNYPIATYSGMLPGVLAGQYSPERMEIDLVRLCSAVGARLILGDVTGLDRNEKHLLFEGRPPLPYDVLSIGIGSVPQSDAVNRNVPPVVAIKPMQTLMARLEAQLARALSADGSLVRLVIVGGGAGGVEVAFCVSVRLRGSLAATPFHITLVTADERLIGGVTMRTSAVALEELERRGIDVILGHRVTAVTAEGVKLDDDRELPASIVLWATNAIGSSLLSQLGLRTDERGFLPTRPTLQTIEDDAVFAVGDAGTIHDRPTPKAGVYAVRQGPILWANLARSLRNESLIEYVPQRNFLKLFNTGDGRAIGEYQGFTFFSRWAWRLKDWIDRRFMDMYQVDQPNGMGGGGTTQNAGMQGRIAMTRASATRLAEDDRESQLAAGRCTGCGGKVSSAVLARVLDKLDVRPSEHVLIGLAERDDAAVMRVPAAGLVAWTVDFFTAPLDDAFLVGRIAALNSASDCFATGSRPLAALASAILPVGPERKQEQLLYELLAGALHEFHSMSVALVGGHTIEGQALTIGFSMLAAQDGPPRTKSKLRVGDYLILTKPLGVGILLAAHMRARCRASWWEPLLDTMLLSNQFASSLYDECDVQGVTDVTGFGLAGHLLEMLRASRLAAEVRLSDIPLLSGTEQLLRDGIESTLAPANRRAESDMDVPAAFREVPSYRALFDPQTSGGLLMGVPEPHVDKLLSRLRQKGAVPAAMIGRVVAHADAGARLRIVG